MMSLLRCSCGWSKDMGYTPFSGDFIDQELVHRVEVLESIIHEYAKNRTP